MTTQYSRNRNPAEFHQFGQIPKLHQQRLFHNRKHSQLNHRKPPLTICLPVHYVNPNIQLA